MSATLKPRWMHSLTATSLGPGLTEVTMFGGTAQQLTGSDDALPKLADTTLLQRLTGSADTLPKLADTTLLQFSKCDVKKRFLHKHNVFYKGQ